MPSTGCCSLRLDYCRAEPTFGAAERELRDVSHFPHKPQSGLRTVDWGVGETHPWPSGCTFLASQALEKTNHNSTSTSAYFLFGRRLSFVTPPPPFLFPLAAPPLVWFAWLRFGSWIEFMTGFGRCETHFLAFSISPWRCDADARDLVLN